MARQEHWDDELCLDYIDQSGEFGEHCYKVRRVRTVDAGYALQVEGLTRVEWFNPDATGTNYEWDVFMFIKKGEQ